MTRHNRRKAQVLWQHRVEKMRTLLHPSRNVPLLQRQKLKVLLACASTSEATRECLPPKLLDSWWQTWFSELGKNSDDCNEFGVLLKTNSDHLWLIKLISSQSKPSKIRELFCSVLYFTDKMTFQKKLKNMETVEYPVTFISLSTPSYY